MLKLIITSSLLLTLTGCFETAPVKPTIVEVPIQVKCKPTQVITELPPSPLEGITGRVPLAKKIKGLIFELEMVKAQNIELKTALEECTK